MGETAVINDELMLMLVLVIGQRAESEGQRGRGRKTDNETTEHGTTDNTDLGAGR
jgi:hypothetical protein